MNNKNEISNGTRVFVFGNPDVAVDALPVRLLGALRERFSEHTFTVLDPNEEWDVPRDMTIIDTVLGIEKVTVFENLTSFLKAPRVTCHDYDAYTNLQFLFKLKKLDSVRIIGIPPNLSEEEALKNITVLITV